MTMQTTKMMGQFGALVLSAALAVPVMAQQAQQQPTSTPPSAPAATTPAASTTQMPSDKEGFWGHLNPFARKGWVKKRIDPINDRLTELDQVNAKNAKDISDVDARAQAGIQKAQSAADAANQAATSAGTQAQNAHQVAQNASGQVDQINGKVNGLDQYHPIQDVDVNFRGGSPVLSTEAKQQLDDMAAKLAGRQGYIVEMEAHSPAAGAAGIQSSERLAEAVKRYLVTEHQIPVYRMHEVALGNAQVASNDGTSARVKTSSVHIRLMENSLAAQDAASPHGAASSTGAEQP
ncbi:MAG: OmpA family protein [Acidobacteriota bacterium]|nr:OmpA family protein [Acidobacteriota bacterium]